MLDWIPFLKLKNKTIFVWLEKYLSKCSLFKHTWSLSEKLILWTLNRQVKILLRIKKISENFLYIYIFITFNQIYKTNSKIKHKKHKTIHKLYTRLYLVITFSLTYTFPRYHRWNRQKQPSKRCSIERRSQKSLKTHRNKHPHQSLPFNKTIGQRPTTLLKNRPWHRIHI